MRRKRSTIPGGFFQFEEEKTKLRLTGYGHGDHIKLKDDNGNVWMGSAQRAENHAVIYRFRDPNGRTISGISENMMITLRDERGRTWKGFVD